MNRSQKQVILSLQVIIDLIMVSIGWLSAYFIRFKMGLPVLFGVPAFALYFKLLPFIAIIWFVVFSKLGLYRRHFNLNRKVILESLDIIQCSVIATFAFIAFTYFYEEYRYSRVTIFIFAFLHPLLIILGRSLIRKAIRRYRKMIPIRNVLVIGSDDPLARTLELCSLDLRGNARIYGVIIPADSKHTSKDKSTLAAKGIKTLATPGDWTNFFITHPIDTVYFALPNSSYQYLEQNLTEIAAQVADVKIIPDILRYTRLSAGIELQGNIPIISVHESPLQGIGNMLKRSVDLIGALVGLIVFAPILSLISILIPLTSRGPIFYRQQRMGLDGRPFECLKFRSMPIDAERHSGAVWAKKDDNRATFLGGFLRRSSLDELPQLFNVLRGEMSLVGPRPERPVFVNRFRQYVPGYMLRHKVKAGITGWAQVNGLRGNTSIEKRIECDLYYIHNWSIWFDFKILFMTIQEVLFSKHAY